MTPGTPALAPSIGLILNQEEEPGRPTPRWQDMAAFAADAEAIGVDALWLVDHFMWEGDPWGRDEAQPYGVWEAWTTLGALASATSRVRLGTLVTCTGYRNPALLAKMADTADEICDGRLVLGMGAGDAPDEHRRFGFPFERRVSRFAEALEIIVPLLRTGRASFAGEMSTARDAELRPRGPRATGPPILIGSLTGRPRMLSLVARYADIWNAWIPHRSRAEEIPALREAVDAACVAHGRDPASLARSVAIAVAFEEPMPGAIAGGANEIADALHQFAAEGIGELQVRLFPNDRHSVEGFSRVLEVLNS
jgi:alkanesulfonate monooxygenase SsuD/methylene tetrahydromethanopterin reductase-like flavin-dependent oxidoreductase (luciferase family)